MKLSEFNTHMPEALIANYPAPVRDESRLMVVHRRTGEIEHRIFKEILEYFNADDLFVFNNTKVFPARLSGNKEKTGAKIEVFLLRELNANNKLWDVLVDPARKIRIGNKLYFGLDDSMVAEVIDNTTSRGRTLRFLYDSEDHDQFKKNLFALGRTPLPYYIKREPEPDDAERYQTTFASVEGAVVAPAAGLHFSRELLRRMEIYDIRRDFMTMHISLGTFRDIDVEDLSKHRLDSEPTVISEELVDNVNNTRDAGHKVCAIGVSVLRGMETAVAMNGHIKPYNNWSNKFLFPPYEVTTIDALVTNFHMPYSVMLMATAAFGGYETVMNAYRVAIEEKYRFGAYGDAMLIID